MTVTMVRIRDRFYTGPIIHATIRSSVVPRAGQLRARRHVGGEDLVGVPVEVLAGPVVAHSGARAA
jgi:hypothetical protein